jgi:hypothetical protein
MVDHGDSRRGVPRKRGHSVTDGCNLPLSWAHRVSGPVPRRRSLYPAQPLLVKLPRTRVRSIKSRHASVPWHRRLSRTRGASEYTGLRGREDGGARPCTACLCAWAREDPSSTRRAQTTASAVPSDRSLCRESRIKSTNATCAGARAAYCGSLASLTSSDLGSAPCLTPPTPGALTNAPHTLTYSIQHTGKRSRHAPQSSNYPRPAYPCVSVIGLASRHSLSPLTTQSSHRAPPLTAILRFGRPTRRG